MTNNTKEIDDNFIMLPTVDYCFKELMHHDNVRRNFIAAILKVAPESIEKTTLLPTEMWKEWVLDKGGMLDVHVLLEDNTRLNMEMQANFFKFWDERVLYYVSKMYSSQSRKGGSYGDLRKCIHVGILNFVRFPNDEECYRIIHLRDDKTGEPAMDKLEFHVLELPKLPEKIPGGNHVLCWMKFFSLTKKEEFKAMAETNKYLAEAYDELERISADEAKRWAYISRDIAQRDYVTQMESAEKRGLEQGMERGMERGLERGKRLGEETGRKQVLEIIRLHQQGRTPEEIAKKCSLPQEEIKSILDVLISE